MKKILGILLIVTLIMAMGLSAYAESDVKIEGLSDISVGNITEDSATFKTEEDNFTKYSYNTGTGVNVFESKIQVVGSLENGDTVTISENSSTEKQISVEKPTLSASEFTVKCGTDNKGIICGTTSSMEYKLKDAESWTKCTADLGNLASGTYLIRYAGVYSSADKKITLASDAVEVTVPEYYTVWVGGTQVTSTASSGTGWTYDVSTKTLKLTGDIIGSYKGAAIYSENDLNIIVAGNVTVKSNGVNLDTTDNSYFSYGIQVTGNLVISSENSGELTVTALATSTEKQVDKSEIITANELTIKEGATVKVVCSNAVIHSWGIYAPILLDNSGNIEVTLASSKESYGIYATDNFGATDVTVKNNSTGTIDINDDNCASVTGEVCGIHADTYKISNSGTISVSVGSAAKSVAIDGDIQNDNGAIDVISGTATAYSCGIEGSVTNTGTGGVYALSGDATESGGESIGICGNVVSSGDTISVGAGNATGAKSCAVYGNVTIKQGKFSAASGSGAGTEDYAVYGNLTIDTATATTDAEVEATGTTGAISGTVVYNNFTPVIKTGTANPGTEVEKDKADYKSKYVHILRKGAVYVSSVEISPESLSLIKGKTGEFSAAVTMSDGSTYAGDYDWYIDDTAVATYAKESNKATITALSKGTTTITCTAGGVTSKTYEIKVTDPKVTSVVISPASLDLDLVVTKSGVLTATVTMDDGSTYSGDYEWKVSSSSVAVLTEGSANKATVTAKGVGTTTVTCTAGGVTSNSCTVNVAQTKDATSITIPSYLGVKPSASTTITATLGPTGATGKVNWSIQSGSSTVIKITPNTTDTTKCTITGVKAGEEIVVATLASDSSKKAYCKVTVSSSGEAYKITPSYGAWYIDKTDGYTFKLNTTNTISSVKINGTALAFSPQTYSSGYQDVTIPYGSMKTLSRGYSQPLVVTFSDGTYATGKVAVIYTTDAPPTGDVNLGIYAAMALLSATGTAGIAVISKKKRK